MKRILAVGQLLALAASLVFAQQALAQQRDAQPSHIDVDGYTIDAQINPSTQTLNAHVVVRFVSLDDQANSATFELNNNLSISQITDAKGTVLQSARTQSDNTVRVTFPGTLPKGQMTEITFAAFPDAILALSVYGTIDFANPAALELLKGLDSLKTPLSSIRMGLHLLLEEKIGPLNPKQLELLLAAREDSERLLRMINDLLDLARLESGQTRQRFEIISPTTLTKNASPNLMPLVEANDARLVTDIAPELPDVAVDLRQIGHVFSGGIGLQSTSGKGSEFYFDLPATSNGVKA